MENVGSERYMWVRGQGSGGNMYPGQGEHVNQLQRL